MIRILEWLKAVLYGVIEGITEWLPISSTGHLILIQDLIPFSFSSNATFLDEFSEMFQVVIQLGAILAVVVLFWGRLWPLSRQKTAVERRSTLGLWLRVLIASLPAAIIGIVGDKLLEKLSGKDIDGWLYHSAVVAAALIVYGIAFLVIERLHRGRMARVDRIEDISFSTALKIGAFQALSIVPGTSRSGSDRKSVV